MNELKGEIARCLANGQLVQASEAIDALIKAHVECAATELRREFRQHLRAAAELGTTDLVGHPCAEGGVAYNRRTDLEFVAGSDKPLPVESVQFDATDAVNFESVQYGAREATEASESH